MEHRSAGTESWKPSGDDHFTGVVWNTRLSEGDGRPTVIAVQFSPGARSDWHTHPNGQLLFVVSGAGLVQTEAGATIEISPGDVVYAPPGETHWHGAKPESPLLHLSVTTGGVTEWGGKVTDEEYLRRDA